MAKSATAPERAQRVTSNIGRRLIAATPLLLIMGIVAQVFLLVAIIILYIPCLIYPKMLDGMYRWITRGMARIFARSVIGKRREVDKV